MNGLAVQRYIAEHGFDALEKDLAIEAREYPAEGLVVLNYNQSESPKLHPVVRECRGLILDAANGYRVVARSFDRFFNGGEVPEETPADFSRAIVLEKIDGSLLTVYELGGRWNTATRGMAFAEGRNTAGNTFAEVARRVVPLHSLQGIPKDLCLLFELVSPESRVVTPYKRDEVYLLAGRDRETGRELSLASVASLADSLGVPVPRRHALSSLAEIKEAAAGLPRMQEGYVCVFEGPDGVHQRVKIKNPAYLAVAHLRGNGDIAAGRKIGMALAGEDVEYLAYFPEDSRVFTPVREFLLRVREDAEGAFSSAPKTNRKEFAEFATKTAFPWILFRMFDGMTAEQAIRSGNHAALERMFKA